MADRHRDRGRLGRLRGQLLLDPRAAHREAPLRRDLVLHRDDRHGRGPAHRQLALAIPVSGLKSYSIFGGAQGRARAVVVRAQRRRLLPDDAHPRHHVLLPAEGGRAAGLLVPAQRRPLLVARLRLHLGGPAPPAQHGAARLGADARHGLQRRCSGRRAGAACSTACSRSRGPGTRSAPIRCSSSSPPASPSTAWPPSRGRCSSIKSVNGLAHYTDWIIGHVHSGALGWNGFMAAGMFYWLVPRLYGTRALLEEARRHALLDRRRSASSSTSSRCG